MCGDRELRERHTLALVGALLHGDIVLLLEFAGRLIYVFGTDGEVSESVVFLRGVAGIHSGAIFGFVALRKVQGVERMKGDGEKEGKKTEEQALFQVSSRVTEGVEKRYWCASVLPGVRV